MNYEKETERLLRLYEEVSTESENEEYDDEEEVDRIETRSDDSDTEQEFDESEQENSNRFTYREPTYIGKDRITKWRKHSGPRNVRTRKQNIIKILPGVKAAVRDMKSPIDIWTFFFDENMLENIVSYTNIKIQSLSENFSRDRDAKPTNIPEIKALFGLLYLAGVRRANHLNTQDLWKVDGTGIEAFRLTMSINRFKFLLACIRFDDINTREERKILDKLAPIRSLFDSFIQHCKDAYSHSEFVTVDEKLEAFRGKCSFRQYIPSKPNKYGLKVFALCDAKTFYTSAMEVYVGLQPDGPYRQDNSAKCVVERLCQSIYGSNRNVTTDNWFTSMPLADSLKDKKLTLLGTMRKNKREIPPEMTQDNGRPEGSSIFAFQEDRTLVSYVPKRKKNVLVLSTMHFTDDIDPNSNKPEMVMLYNMTKGGVDVVDKLCAQYNCARNTRRWPMVIFYSMLNVAAINSFIIYTQNNPTSKVIRRDFNQKLYMALVFDYQKLRVTWAAVPRTIKMRLREICGIPTEEPSQNRTDGQKGRCQVCDHKKNRKTKYYCCVCKKFLCLEHISPTCQDCSPVEPR